MHYAMLFSVCIIYVTAIAFMCFANKHIIIIINIGLLMENIEFTRYDTSDDICFDLQNESSSLCTVSVIFIRVYA